MFFIHHVVFLVTIASCVSGKDDILRTYTLRKDYFNGIKVAEFSVFDISKTTLYYRIESKFSILPKFELISYPSKQVVGKLEGKLGKINLSLLDDKTGQWVTGTMKQHVTLLKHYQYNIELNGRQILMKKELLSSHTTFHDAVQNGETLLARYQREFFSPITATTYGVQIFSNELPDGLYLLALAWTDIGRSESYGPKNG
ncbi:unnamed protein product [Adineta steineri]|uniref:Uncharacterized protein n=1 Tax=Adineta steineri TaxID=433720 RepID=A0A814XHD3_9BILA|nr:unnamed protein product [Adineta steineri]CAF1405855.1 unnamed protein product [Adineta steineri]